jgi:hypothetical protein
VADQRQQATFSCGGSRNFSRFIGNFDAVFVLEVDLATLNRRPDDEWAGGIPIERERIVRWHQTGEDVPGAAFGSTPPRRSSASSTKSSATARSSKPGAAAVGDKGALVGRIRTICSRAIVSVSTRRCGAPGRPRRPAPRCEDEGHMPYRIYEGWKFVREYATEAEALAAIREYCATDGVPLPDAVQGLNMNMSRTDERGRIRRWWGGAHLVARLQR